MTRDFTDDDPDAIVFPSEKKNRKERQCHAC